MHEKGKQFQLNQKSMTYKKLLETLQNIPAERLEDAATVFDPYTGEFITLVNSNFAEKENCDALDEGHLFLVLKA